MQRALFFTSLLLSLSVAAEESLLELSLEEFLEIDLSGDSVKTIDLKSEVFTSNPFYQPIINFPFSIEVLNSELISAKGIKNIVQVVQNFTGVLSGESSSGLYLYVV
ncbi:MAG: hypothetical protein P8I03_12515 [Thalassotalea sp.]|nr:hypothetical protein [Thalassotalea sp.]